MFVTAQYNEEFINAINECIRMSRGSQTLQTEMPATTVYSLNELQPMKWNNVFPLHVKWLVPSGIKPRPWVSLYQNRVNRPHTVTHRTLWWMNGS